jgi:Arc/MetJ-type ribon-helix-helix transcriptional regulator
MAKETVRYPDALVAGVEAVVAESDAFESKSEFYRFASDFLLSVVDEDHEPTALGYGDIVSDLEATTGASLDRATEAGEATTGPFLDAYIQVRRHLLYDDVERARAVVAERYDATDREALLLDEVIGRERHERRTGRARDPAVEPVSSPRVDGATEDDGEPRGGGGTPEEVPSAVESGTTPEGETEDASDRKGSEESKPRPTGAVHGTDGGTAAPDESS